MTVALTVLAVLDALLLEFLAGLELFLVALLFLVQAVLAVFLVLDLVALAFGATVLALLVFAAILVLVVTLTFAARLSPAETRRLEVDTGHRVVDQTTLGERRGAQPERRRECNEVEGPAKPRVAIMVKHRDPPSRRLGTSRFERRA